MFSKSDTIWLKHEILNLQKRNFLFKCSPAQLDAKVLFYSNSSIHCLKTPIHEF